MNYNAHKFKYTEPLSVYIDSVTYIIEIFERDAEYP